MRSLRSRLALVVGVATLVVVTLATTLVVRQNWQRAEAEMIDDVIAVAETQDRAIAGQFDDGVPLTLDEPAAGDVVAVFDEFGDIIEMRGSLGVDAVLDLADEFEVAFLTEFELLPGDGEADGKQWAVVATGCLEPLACSALLVARERAAFGDYLLDRVAWLAAIVTVAVLMMVLAIRWVVGRSLRPVERMRRELDEITAADLDRRIAVPGGGDEVAALAASFNNTIERLAHGVAAQQRFASDAAHELRSPLAGVRATLEVAQRQPERAVDGIATAIGQVDRASRLLDDLLVLARRDANRAAVRTSVADLDDLALDVIREVTARVPTLTIDRSGVRPVQADVVPDSFSRIARNLIDNATVHASTQVRVSLRTARDDRWRLMVEDDGPGVPVVDRERIFERFTRLDESRSRDTGGTGLGLAIVRELIAELGGWITVTTSDLGGAAFVVEAPRSRTH